MKKEIIVGIEEATTTKYKLRKKGYNILGTENESIGRVKISYGTGGFRI